MLAINALSAYSDSIFTDHNDLMMEGQREIDREEIDRERGRDQEREREKEGERYLHIYRMR